MAYDLIVKASPTTPGSRSRAFTVTEEIRKIDALSQCEIEMGPNAPNSIDLISLDDCLATGECSEKDFAAFCTANNLARDTSNEASAAAFVDSLWGLTLTFIKLPTERDLAVDAYAAIIEFAKAKELRIDDPQVGRDVDLRAPSEVPSGWG